MSIIAQLTSKLTVIETLAGNRPFASDAKAKVTHDLLDETGVPVTPATQAVGFQKALAAGVGTIDLRALPATNEQAGITDNVVDGNGLRVRAMKLRNPVTNANPIIIKFGAANPYVGFGAAFNLSIFPGMTVLVENLDVGNVLAAIGATNKTLDMTGTGTQALDVLIVLG